MCMCMLVWPHGKQHSTHTHTHKRSSQEGGKTGAGVERRSPAFVSDQFTHCIQALAMVWWVCRQKLSEVVSACLVPKSKQGLGRVAHCCGH